MTEETFLLYERLLENYCFVLPTNRAPPQVSDNRLDMRQRALFVTSRAAWHWKKMLLAHDVMMQLCFGAVLAIGVLSISARHGIGVFKEFSYPSTTSHRT